MAEDSVSKDTLEALVKGINGDLTDLKVGLRDLTDTMNRRFDALDAKMLQERTEGREAHQRLHDRVDTTNTCLAAEMVGVGEAMNTVKDGIDSEMKDIRKGHVSKATAAVWTLLTAVALSAITAFVTLLIAR